MKELSQRQWTIINWMSREQLKRILEGYGFAVNDWERASSMRLALAECIRDGSIHSSILEEKE